MVLGYAVEPSVITRVLTSGRQEGQSLREEVERRRQRSEWREATRQGKQAASRS